MDIASISWLGWIHTIACVIALITGAGAILTRKGSRTHEHRGTLYIYAMLAANATALGIYSLGGFNVFHWMAIAGLALALTGWFTASRQRIGFFAYAHPAAMILSYYLLIGGAVNEAFVRIAVVSSLGDTALGFAHGCVALIFLLALTFVMGRVAGKRARATAHLSSAPA